MTSDEPRIGALFAGYGGLDLAVQDVFGGHMAWYSEIDKGALKILEHRFPDVPNVGSVTEADWSTVEPIDILTGGSPCQDLSHAGRRAGMTEGTRSNLWVAMREAIAQLRPSVVVWENVRGAYSAAADSAVEPCPGCVGDGPGVHLRALGRVLGDLSDLGYDASWHGLRAADVGAPHGRFRVFVVATDAQRGGRNGWASDAVWQSLEGATPARGSQVAGLALLSTPQSRDHMGVPGDNFNQACLARDVSLLPTPAVNDMGEGKTVERWDEWTDDMKAKHGNGNGHGKSLAIEAQRLLPTPRVTQAGYADDGRGGKSLDVEVRDGSRWGDYATAIARWEQRLYAQDRIAEQLLIPGYIAVGRPAPEPTQTSNKGNPQLSPAFVEWMMGLPAGWVTDVPGITRNEALKALGNGVCPAQCAAALRVMLAWSVAA